MRSARFWVVLLLLVVTAVILRRRGDVDWVPPSRPLNQLPEQIGMWTGTEIPLNQTVLDILGKGVFLNRIYLPAQVGPVPVGTVAEAKAVALADSPADPPADHGPVRTTAGKPDDGGAVDPGLVTLFIAYFPTQRTGQAIHSPQNCLPGSGWTFESSGIANLSDASGKRYKVGEYLISDGRTKQEVLYWYRSHGRSIANDYVAKLYTLADSIRYNRTDAALIRVVTPLQQGEDQHQAHVRAVSFAEQMVPLLPAYIPN